MDINQLKNFLVLCQTLNFREASEQINIVQPALSRQIQLLENEIGAVLFNRTNRHVEISEAGKYFQEQCTRILLDLEKCINTSSLIHKGEAGEIKIGHSSSAMQTVLPNFLQNVKIKYPKLRANLIEVSNIEIMEMLENRQIDIGIGPNMLPKKDIVFKLIYEENFALILPSDFKINDDRSFDLSVLQNEKFILPALYKGYGYLETINAICAQYGFLPDVAYESAQSASVLRLVEAGMGVSIEPISNIKRSIYNIKHIELSHLSQKVQIKIHWLKNRQPELQRYIDVF